jgi:hypothetical protein
MDSLIAKAEKANQLFSKLNSNINRDYQVKQTEFNKPIQHPTFL